MVEMSGHRSEHVTIINVFYDVNSILYMVTNIYSTVGITKTY